ncbi:MAG: hypothetical protein P0107_04975 [Nitrosomonas sp.]|nr:hypothetical protein [Nitrosomonas sp.]
MTAFKAHLLAAMLVYSLFTIAPTRSVDDAARTSLAITRVSRYSGELPPLLVMENVIPSCMGWILSCSASPALALFSRRNYSASLSHLTHKSLFGFISGNILRFTGGKASVRVARSHCHSMLPGLLHLFCPIGSKLCGNHSQPVIRIPEYRADFSSSSS